MDIMQEMLGFLKSWLANLKKVTAYLQQSFLPQEGSKGSSQGIIWWF